MVLPVVEADTGVVLILDVKIISSVKIITVVSADAMTWLLLFLSK